MTAKILNNRYQLTKELGEGGMALVYEAHDRLLNRQVAVKILRSQYVNDKVFIGRFRREAQAVATFSHPNIVNIFDIAKDQNIYYIVMEKVEGETLKQKINTNHSLEIVDALRIIKQIAQALVVAHRNDIIHCDIKPANILLTDSGKTKLTDFGIAKALNSSTLTHTETVLGSANYFAPEQAKGGLIDARTDVYSLGIVLYEMVTGDIPFKGDTPVSVALKHIKELPKSPLKLKPDLPACVETIIMKAIKKEPSARYQSAQKMLVDINKAIRTMKKEKESSTSITEQNENEKTIMINKQELSGHVLNSSNNELEDQAKQEQAEDDSSIKEEKPITKEAKKEEEPTIEQASFIKRNRRGLVIIMLLIVLLGSGWWSYNRLIDFLEVPVVEVPDLSNQELEAAEEKISSFNLGFAVYEQRYDNEVPEGHIISQNPNVGREVRENREVRVVVSKGPRLTEVPDIIKMSLREARVALDDAELKLGETTTVFNDNIPQGQIINQSLEPGSEVKINSSIGLIISEGEEQVAIEVPKLVGLDKAEAEQKLRDLDLLIGRVEYEDSLDILAEQVLEQEPGPGAEVSVGSEIDLVVSEGIRNVHDSEVHDFRVRVSINPGPEEQEVEIVIQDDNGRRVAYNEVHSPGDLINEKLISVGSTVLQVYINGNLVREQRF